MEGGDDKHSRVVLIIRLCAQQLGHRRAVLGVQGSVDLVKQVKGCRVAALDGKDEGQSNERLLAARQELQAHRLVAATERDTHLGKEGRRGREERRAREKKERSCGGWVCQGVW